ncbi:hypothetical protein Agub_g15412 [Astrephomene gubernaculifera]|uniref:RING-type domain-containing protein n=1 Tax=Astrephomene gubernaculifera TaxID=47775 RepID=A0AAD3HTY6_9CHLO|nr:hypothetical protein Agub_g15412 [Astrephomene gubernaculifera]
MAPPPPSAASGQHPHQQPQQHPHDHVLHDLDGHHHHHQQQQQQQQQQPPPDLPPEQQQQQQPPLLPYRLLYPVGSRKWNCRAAPHKRAALLGAYSDGQTVLAQPVHQGGACWLAVRLGCGQVGYCKQHDEVHMLQHHNTRTGYGWYRVVYCRLADEAAFGMSLETLTPELLRELAATPPPAPAPSLAPSASPPSRQHPTPAAPAASPSTPPPPLAPPSSSSSSAPPAPLAAPAGAEQCRRDRCAGCRLPLRPGGLAYVGSCGHSFHFECLRALGDANICTACGVWFAVGQSPPAACPPPAPTSVFQHVHQALWFVPPFYRYILIYGAMLLLSPLVILASWLGLL